MGRHSFREADVVRDDWGRFGNKNTSSQNKPAADASGATTQRGMPDVIATSTVKLKGGGALKIGQRADGGMTLTGDHGDVTFDSQGAEDLRTSLRFAETNMDIGGREVVKHQQVSPDGVYTTLIGQIDRTGSDSYQVRLDDDDPSFDELADNPPLNLTGKDIDRITDTSIRFEAAARVDTGYGDADIFITDDNKFAFRHLGDDGKPVEVAFNSKSFAKIMGAVNVVGEGFDEMEYFVKAPDPEADFPEVTSLDIPTNVGKVRVEQLGEWGGNGPNDRLMITPVDGDDWGIVVEGSKQSDWWDAMSEASEVGQALDFHDPM